MGHHLWPRHPVNVSYGTKVPQAPRRGITFAPGQAELSVRNGVFENDTFNGESFRWCPTTDHEVLGQRGCKCEQSDIVNAEVTDLTRRIVLMERMIADFDRMAADLDQGIRIEEDRVKIRDPA